MHGWVDSPDADPYVHALNTPSFSDTSTTTVPDPSTLHVLRLLDERPQLTQREMARELGVSLGKANYCLRALLSEGLVQVQSFHNSTTRRYAYFLTPAGVAAKAHLTRHFLARKRAEYDALRLEIERLQRETESETAR